MITLSAPTKVCIDILNNCNLSCIHCHAQANELLDDALSTEEIITLINDLSDLKVFVLQIGGGEPLLHPNFYQIVHHANSKGLHAVMSTNGTLIDKKHARLLLNAGFKQIQVSLDGASATTHDAFRGISGSFQKTINGIRQLVKIGIEVSIASTLSTLNIKEIEPMVDLSISLGATSFRTMCFMPGGRALNRLDLMLTHENLITAVKELRKLRDERNDKIHIEYEAPFIPKPESRARKQIDPIDEYFAGCEAGKRECRILSNGDVVPCPLFSNKSIVAGNIRKKSFLEIWLSSPVFQEFRELGYKNKKGKCTKCDFGYLCNGGCPAVSFNLSGDIYLPDPRCRISTN